MPESNNVEEFWNLFTEGKCAIRPVPEGRWIKEQSSVILPEHKKANSFKRNDCNN
jgi:acyl transferase domain-containing protein